MIRLTCERSVAIATEGRVLGLLLIRRVTNDPAQLRAASWTLNSFSSSATTPSVYPQFRMLAVKLKAKGIDRWGAKAIWEVLRYEMALKSVTTGEKYALNNNFTSRFARKLRNEEPRGICWVLRDADAERR